MLQMTPYGQADDLEKERLVQLELRANKIYLSIRSDFDLDFEAEHVDVLEALRPMTATDREFVFEYVNAIEPRYGAVVRRSINALRKPVNYWVLGGLAVLAAAGVGLTVYFVRR